MKLQHECIEDALGALAKDRPAAPALQAPGRKPLTYADLAARSTAFENTSAAWTSGEGISSQELFRRGRKWPSRVPPSLRHRRSRRSAHHSLPTTIRN